MEGVPVDDCAAVVDGGRELGVRDTQHRPFTALGPVVLGDMRRETGGYLPWAGWW